MIGRIIGINHKSILWITHTCTCICCYLVKSPVCTQYDKLSLRKRSQLSWHLNGLVRRVKSHLQELRRCLYVNSPINSQPGYLWQNRKNGLQNRLSSKPKIAYLCWCLLFVSESNCWERTLKWYKNNIILVLSHKCPYKWNTNSLKVKHCDKNETN